MTFPVFFLFLFAAIFLYAVAGSPTPDHPGWVEGAIGVLLILSVASGLRDALDLRLGKSFYLRSLQLLFLCGLIVPTLSGVYFGNDPGLMLRDGLAFLFLGLPLFLADRFAEREDAARLLRHLLIFAGVAFCVRTLMPVFNVWVPQGELLYLSNSPLALFAALFFAGMFWTQLMVMDRASLLKACGYLAGLAVVMGAMMLDIQRATVMAVFLSFAALSVLSLAEKPRKAILPLIIVIAAGGVIYPWLNEIIGAMVQKTADVGLNMRVQEMRAVSDAVMREPLAFFIGRGWGSVFASPAVGMLDVNYTHSFLTTLFLKGGVMMLLPGMIVIFAALREIFLLFQRDRVMAVSLFWPLIIPAFLYASHKSLDYGLIFLMIGVWSVRGQALPRAPVSDKK